MMKNFRSSDDTDDHQPRTDDEKVEIQPLHSSENHTYWRRRLRDNDTCGGGGRQGFPTCFLGVACCFVRGWLVGLAF